MTEYELEAVGRAMYRVLASGTPGLSQTTRQALVQQTLIRLRNEFLSKLRPSETRVHYIEPNGERGAKQVVEDTEGEIESGRVSDKARAKEIYAELIADIDRLERAVERGFEENARLRAMLQEVGGRQETT